MLPCKHRAVFENFCQGKFTVTKSNRLFSSMAEDQAHEHNNKMIKDDGGAIGLFDNPSALLE